jgi:NADH-quinone oxidoreductase subunit G
MYVRTRTEQVQEARRDVLEFLLSSHPLDCPVCDKGGECPLQNLTMRHGPGTSRMAYDDKLHLDKHVPLGDLIYLDRERCIQCARCVRFQDEVVGDDVLAFHERGRHLQIITTSTPAFDTYFSGNTTDICPVGALTTADFRFGARPWELTNVPSISPHGPVGENIALSMRLDRDSGGVQVIKRVIPRQNEDVNEIWISDKTRFGHHFTLSPDRLREALIRKRGELTPVALDDALKAAAKALKEAGNSVGFIGGPMTSNEDFFALRELAAHVGSRKLGLWPATLGDAAPAAEVGIASGSRLTELGKGDALLVVASDLEEEAPIWFLQAKQAADRGAALIVANLRETKLDRYAGQTVRYGLGGAVGFLNGAAADETLAKAANLVVFVGNEGLGADEHGAALRAAANLLIATGHAGRRNNGLIPVWPGANTQGGFDLGFSAATRAMLQSAPDVLIVVGADVSGDSRRGGGARRGQIRDRPRPLPDATTAKADVVLPIQSFAERDGTFTNAMRRVQRFYTAQGPVGKACPPGNWWVCSASGWAWIARAGRGPGDEGPGGKCQALRRDELPALAERRSRPRRLHLARLLRRYGAAPTGGTGLQWPSKAEGRAKLSVTPVEAPQAVQAGTGELVIVPLRRLYDRAPEFFASVVMHGRIPQPFVALHPSDAARRGLVDGGRVKLSAAGASLDVTAGVDDTVPEGLALLPLRLAPGAFPRAGSRGGSSRLPKPSRAD